MQTLCTVPMLKWGHKDGTKCLHLRGGTDYEKPVSLPTPARTVHPKFGCPQGPQWPGQKLCTALNWHGSVTPLTLCLPCSPICTSVHLPSSPICTVINMPIVHSYCSMKRLPSFLVCIVRMRYLFGLLVFPYDLQVKRYSKLKIILPKWCPNSSALQNNVAHKGFVHGKQRVKRRLRILCSLI